MDLLVLGGRGLLGTELLRALPPPAGTGDGSRRLAATFHANPPGDAADGGGGVSWHRLDVRDAAAVRALLASLRPATVINAAYRQSDWQTTADGAANVAAACAATGAHLIHVSSDAVFSGRAVRYPESSRPDPITPYGAAKAAAETGVRALTPDAVIARTSLIVGDRGDSVHESRVHALIAGTTSGALFTDDIRCPVHVADLAAALLELAGVSTGGGARSGVFHLAGPDAVSRHELGVLIARRDGLDPTRLRAARRVETGPPGPLDVRLDCTRTQERLTTRLRGAHEFL